MTRLHARAIGVRAAWVTPRWIEHMRPEDLRPPTATEIRGPGGERHADVARKWAWFTLRVLTRTRIGGWRSTCLYRSAAECLALRALGVPAGLSIGASGSPGGPIEAHAWLEAGSLETPIDADYSVFRHASEATPQAN